MESTLEAHEKRLIAEYYELADKIEKLNAMLDRWKDLDFEPECTFNSLARQYGAMNEYIGCIEERNDFKRLVMQGKVEERSY